MTRTAIRSKHIVTLEGMQSGVILIEGEKIGAVEAYDSTTDSHELIDVGEACVLPGLIDAHVHINEPGRTEWEGFATATRAAAAGGYTCLVDMPLNCIPSTIDVAALELKRDAAAHQAWVDLAFWGAAVPGNRLHIQPLAQAGVAGFKCFLTHPGTQEFEMVNEADLRAAMPEIAKTGLPLLAHAELSGSIEKACGDLEAAGADWRTYATYLHSRPDHAELDAIRLLIDLCREYGCRTHIVHLSSGAALDLLEAAREEGLPLTVETCPHYLYFEAASIPAGATQYKCAPPIRSADNREMLWQGLRSGIIDMIGTDHSPCPPYMKNLESGNFRTAWGGIASLSVSLAAVWTEASQRSFDLCDLARWMAEAPAKLAGLHKQKGCIAPGMDADLVVFYPDRSFKVTDDRLHFRHHCTPYLEKTLRGEVETTFVRGAKCFHQGAFIGHTKGREIPLQRLQ